MKNRFPQKSKFFNPLAAVRLAAIAATFALAVCLFLPRTKSAEAAFDPTPATKTPVDYSRFLHSDPNHQQSCDSCHRRTNNAVTPTFPGHAACTDCHIQQFVTPEIPMCVICHSDVNSAPAPMKGFPTRFNERFTMKFDHAKHDSGAGRPAQGCASCHQPLRRGVALSIPAGINSHANCYTCHTAQSNIGSCNTCHSLGAYSRSSTGGKAFQASFSHAQHGARQRLNCNDCHTVRSGVAQKRQVSLPVTAQHFGASKAVSCMTCHNDKRAFGDADFANCKRCHTGSNFNMP